MSFTETELRKIALAYFFDTAADQFFREVFPDGQVPDGVELSEADASAVQVYAQQIAMTYEFEEDVDVDA